MNFDTPGYLSLTELHKSSRAEIYRAIRSSDSQPVIIKAIYTGVSVHEEHEQCSSEYKLLTALQSVEGVITVYDKQYVIDNKSGQNICLLILEDIEGEPLSQLLTEQKIVGLNWLHIVEQVISIIGDIHNNGILHKNIKPANIVYNLNTDQLRIIDFGVSSYCGQSDDIDISSIQTDYQYISPEQTGRMNRSIDYRSDFYSFGITLYKLLSGITPFLQDDSLELVHAHLAVTPKLLNETNPKVPEVVGNIVAKLLEKNPEDRYQSTMGIAADLHECRKQFDMFGGVDAFPIARKDRNSQLQIPDKLYGREQEFVTMMNCLQQASSGLVEMLVISGSSGIGKSRLIKELYQPTLEKNGFFLTGKFNELSESIPYSALVEALQELVNKLLTYDEQALNSWREKILAAVNENGRVITDLVPQIEFLIGEQPELPSLPAAESENRFNYTLKVFFSVFHQQEHPLVLFFDDLQWADSATLDFISHMMRDESTGYMLLICSLRDDEMSASHQFRSLVAQIENSRCNVSFIEIGALAIGSVYKLLSDTLGQRQENIESLANMLNKKSGGNPFFIAQLLETLYHDELIRFDHSSLSSGWSWDIENIEQVKITDNVVELMIERFDKLPENCLELLRLSSCLGSQFDIKTLAAVQELTSAQVEKRLQSAISRNFISHVIHDKVPLSQDENIYQFSHDRIRQAAYSLTSNSVKHHYHLEIARYLYRTFGEDEVQENLFQLTDSFNLGVESIKDVEERELVLNLNVQAALKAKQAAAYSAALDYVSKAMKIFSLELIKESSLNLQINKVRAELEYIKGNHQQAEHFIAAALEIAKTVQEKISVYKLQIIHNTTLCRYKEAIKTGVTSLKVIGLQVPEDHFHEAITQEINAIKTALVGISVVDLLKEPAMENHSKLLGMSLLNEISSAAYFYHPDLYSWITVKMTALSIQSGIAPESGKAYADYGNVLAYERRLPRHGYGFGMLGLELCRQQKHKGYICRSGFIISSFLVHWVKPAEKADKLADEAYTAGIESGQFLYAGYIIAFNDVMNHFFRGMPIEKIQADLEKKYGLVKNNDNQLAIDIIGVFQSLMEWLSSSYANNVNFEPEQTYNSILSKSVIGLNYIKNIIYNFLDGNYSEGLYWQHEVKKYLTFLRGTMAEEAYFFYKALTIAAHYENLSDGEQNSYLNELEESHQFLKEWAENAPDNFSHHHLLVSAEVARISKQTDEAMNLYDQAILIAEKNGFIQDLAIANELAAKFWFAREKDKFALLYLQYAQEAYLKWGATRKAEQLNHYYPLLSSTTNKQQSNSANVDDNLDLTAMIRASHALSGEIVVEKLLDKMMTIVMESAGADRGVLVLAKGSSLQVAVEIDSSGNLSYPKQSIYQSQDISKQIIQYVARTQEEMVLDDATAVDTFSKDNYIHKNAIKSVLCIPLIKSGELSGLLYLENRNVHAVFNAKRLELLRIIAVQTSISLESATLYSTITESEKRYRSLYERSIEGIVQSSLSGKVVAANPATARLLGYESEEDIFQAGDSIANEWYVHSEQRDELINRIIAEKSVVDFETELYRKDGSKAWVSISAQAILDDEGKLAYIGSSLLDINARKEKEQAERARLNADKANEAKSQFLANMSHEIRTPMNAILGLSHLAIVNLNKVNSPDKRQLDYLEKIHSSGSSLLGLINDILDFSKIEAGKLEIENIGFTFHDDILNKIEHVLVIKAAEKDLELIFDIPAVLPKCFNGDPLRIGQVIINLMNNAVKFTDAGSIVLRLQLGEVFTKTNASSSRNVKLHFEVDDTGIGMTPEQQQGLFKSFSQADSSTTRKYGGTGLGLSISKQLVELMGGEIGFKSEYGAGTTFWFDLPLAINVDCEKVSDTESDYDLKQYDLDKINVLVVDDDEVASKVTSYYLQHLGLPVNDAASGKEALKYLEKVSENEIPDLIFMDWQMPEMSGLEVIKNIKNNKKFPKQPKIIVLTGHDKVTLREQCEEMDVDYVLTKPVSQVSLFESIVKSFNKRVKERRVESQKDYANKLYGSRILLVDDNEINQEVGSELLQNAGIEVTIANNGREAVDKIIEYEQHNNQFDVVLMDIQMPVLDGYKATQEIRQHNKFQKLPIIAMTANAMVTDREKAVEVGMNGHISKPIDPELLYETLTKWVKVPEERRDGEIEVSQDNKGVNEQKLPTFDNIDTEKALKLVLGNEKLFVKVLIGLVNYKDIKLEELADEEFKRTIHTIKGVSASAGAFALNKVAIELDETQNKELLPEFYAELKKVVDEIQEKIIDTQPVKEENNNKMPLTEEEKVKLFKELKEAAKTKRPKNCESIIKKIDEYELIGEDLELFENVKQLISKYKFKQVMEML